MTDRERTAGLGRVLLAWLAGLAAVSLAMLVTQVVNPTPFAPGWIRFDRLTSAITLLVACVGLVCLRFSLRYLDGERRQASFLGWLALAVSAAYLLMIASNLLLLFAAWTCTSIALHQLLTFYRERPEAWRAARKKFVISRVGDVTLLAAIGLIWASHGTLDLYVYMGEVGAQGASFVPTLTALLLVAAALTKSAQFPFHSWLPETMEAPTPVSALMHAGIINAGGALLLRFAPLLAQTPLALFCLALAGTLTAVLGMLAMWAQTDVKRTLAWSTVSQMGFMMVQLGLAAFPAAALHIVGHGLYKARSFLRSGGLSPALKPAAKAAPAAPGRLLTVGLVGTLLAVPCLALAARLTGFDPLHSPGELALAAALALSLGQVWVALFRDAPAGAGTAMRAAQGLLLSFAMGWAAFALYHGAGLFLAPVFGELPVLAGPLAWAAALTPLVAFGALAAVYALLPALERTRAGRALHVHALHGFYVGAVANRLVDRIWGDAPAGRI
jgi:NAD(P)H-quinone oxidoreductase subunit 5